MAKCCWGAALLSVFVLLGCGNGEPRTCPVAGTVTFDGQPIPEGDIIFLDADDVIGPDAGKIKDGRFAFSAKPGKKKVQIWASRMEKRSSSVMDPVSLKLTREMRVSYIPERYSTRMTVLTAEVAEKGPNQFTFALTKK